MGTIRVKRLDKPGKKKGPPGPPRSGGIGKKKKKGKKKAVAEKKTTAIVKPSRRADAPLATRKTRVARAHERLTGMLNFDNCPADYESLKFEAKYLSGLTSYSFAVLAQRLVAIRDGRLYEHDGYSDFKSFVADEIDVNLSTVYRYIDVYSLFGERAEELGAELEYTKLVPVLPLLRAPREDIPRAEIVDRFIKEAGAKTRRQIKEDVERLFAEYGLGKRPEKKRPGKKRDFAAEVDDFIDRLPARPTRKDLDKLGELSREIARLRKKFVSR